MFDTKRFINDFSHSTGRQEVIKKVLQDKEVYFKDLVEIYKQNAHTSKARDWHYFPIYLIKIGFIIPLPPDKVELNKDFIPKNQKPLLRDL